MYTFKAIKFETKLRYHIFTSLLDEKEMNERFEYELYEAITNLVEELQEEEGRLLSQEEIEMVAEEFINQYQLISEESEESEELDPVGQEDGDINNDGDEDGSDGYLKARRAAIAQAMRGE